jgi:hypothetical protein
VGEDTSDRPRVLLVRVEHERSRSSDQYVARVSEAGNAGLDVGLSRDGYLQDTFDGVTEDLAQADGRLGRRLYEQSTLASCERSSLLGRHLPYVFLWVPL